MDVSADKYVYLKLSLVLFSDFLGFHVRVNRLDIVEVLEFLNHLVDGAPLVSRPSGRWGYE